MVYSRLWYIRDMGTYIYFSVTFDCYYQSFVSGRAAGLSKPNFEPHQTFRFPKAGITLNDLYDTTCIIQLV